MSINLLYGKPVADSIYKDIHYPNKKVLHIFQVGDLEESNRYIKNKIKKAESLGIPTQLHKAETKEKVDKILKELVSLTKIPNRDKVSGIFVQLPFEFDRLMEDTFLRVIPPEFDVDGLTHYNLGRLLDGSRTDLNFVPATAHGVVDMLKYYNIPIEGKTVGIIGRSNLVGKPLIPLLLEENATVISMNSYTDKKNLASLSKQCDILVVAIGKANFIDSNFIKDDATVIDVGINFDESGKLVGDVDSNSLRKEGWNGNLSPVPGGVGPLTIANLMRNVNIGAWR